MSDTTTSRNFPLPPHLATTLEQLMHRKDRLRRQLVDIDTQITGLISEHCELIGHSQLTCQYDRERRSLLLHLPTATRDPDATQEARL